MKKTLLVIIATCLLSVVKSQDYISYFHGVTEAENHIRNYQFDSALQVYDSLFQIYSNISYKNIHNACVCAVKTENYNIAFKYAKSLVLKGYDLKEFDNPVFNPLKKDLKKWGLFMKDVINIKEERLSKLNYSERNYYYSKHLIDQEAASSFNVILQDTIFFRLAKDLSQHIKKNGFPNIFLSKDTLAHKVQVMFRHYCGLYNRIKNDELLQRDSSYSCRANNVIKPVVHKALKDGLITPQMYVSIVSYNDGNPFGDLAIKIDIDNKKVFPFLKIKPEDIDNVNNKRIDIGLPQMKENTEAYLFGTWYSDYPFEKIIQAVETCDTCRSFLDYNLVKTNIELKFSDKFNKEDKLKGFLLTDYLNVKNKYCSYKFIKDQIKNGINTK